MKAAPAKHKLSASYTWVCVLLGVVLAFIFIVFASVNYGRATRGNGRSRFFDLTSRWNNVVGSSSGNGNTQPASIAAEHPEATRLLEALTILQPAVRDVDSGFGTGPTAAQKQVDSFVAREQRLRRARFEVERIRHLVEQAAVNTGRGNSAGSANKRHSRASSFTGAALPHPDDVWLPEPSSASCTVQADGFELCQYTHVCADLASRHVKGLGGSISFVVGDAVDPLLSLEQVASGGSYDESDSLQAETRHWREARHALIQTQRHGKASGLSIWWRMGGC
jgi:hypothetical protein